MSSSRGFIKVLAASAVGLGLLVSMPQQASADTGSKIINILKRTGDIANKVGNVVERAENVIEDQGTVRHPRRHPTHTRKPRVVHAPAEDTEDESSPGGHYETRYYRVPRQVTRMVTVAVQTPWGVRFVMQPRTFIVMETVAKQVWVADPPESDGDSETASAESTDP